MKCWQLRFWAAAFALGCSQVAFGQYGPPQVSPYQQPVAGYPQPQFAQPQMPYPQQYAQPQLPVDPQRLPTPYGADDLAANVASEMLDSNAAMAPADPIAAKVAALEKEVAAMKASSKKLPNVTITGVAQIDGVAFSQDDASVAQYGPIQNGADIRRARLGAKGAIADNMNYFFQMDFGFVGRPTFTDVWVEWTQLPVLGNVRVGQWKQPFSLEVVSSFRYTTFMERSSMFQAFTPFRHLGIGFYDHSADLNWTWAASMIRTGQDQYGNSLSTDGGNGVVGRLTHLLWYDEPADGRYYSHIGGAYYYNRPPRDTVRFRSIPEIFVGEHAAGAVGTSGQAIPGALNGTPFFVDTTNILADNVHTFGAENLTVHGPWSFQAEAMAAVVDQQVGGTATLWGTYAQVGYFLTGEHRPYDRIAGAIDRIKPFEDFFMLRTDGAHCYGLGAWEVAARWSYIDLNDGTIVGGQMSNVTLGVNWYCNPYCKVVFNCIHSFAEARTGVDTETTAYGLRAQYDF
jgi:phosphate-selective porin OprO/OprP